MMPLLTGTSFLRASAPASAITGMMTQNRAISIEPWRVSPTILPNVGHRAAGISRIANLRSTGTP